MFKIKNFLVLILTSLLFLSCNFYEKVDQRERPDGAKAKARKNVEEGRGTSLGGVLSRRGGGGVFEFSSSNPMWRATLETLDFLPLTTVDYSGGMIISDWYSDGENFKQSIKITVRFLSNEIRSDSLKVIVHQKNCPTTSSCAVNLMDKSKIKKELHNVILRKAALIEKNKKNKK